MGEKNTSVYQESLNFIRENQCQTFLTSFSFIINQPSAGHVALWVIHSVFFTFLYQQCLHVCIDHLLVLLWWCGPYQWCYLPKKRKINLITLNVTKMYLNQYI